MNENDKQMNMEIYLKVHIYIAAGCAYRESEHVLMIVCGKYRNCIWIEWMTFTATYKICKHEHQLYARVIVNPVYGDIFVEQLSVTRRKEVQLPNSNFTINLMNVIRNLLWK